MKKTILFLLLFFLMLAGIGYLYINNVLLSVKLKNFLTENIQKYTGRNASIEQIYYTFNKGLVVKDVQVFRKDSPSKSLLKIEEISSRILLAPLFKKKIIILPKITINHASLFIKKEANNHWNLSDILSLFIAATDKDAPSDTKKGGYSFLCKSLSLSGSQITYQDSTQANEYVETIEGLNLSTSLSLSQKISFHLTALIKKYDSFLKASGVFLPTRKEVEIKSAFKNIQLAQYIKLFFPEYVETFDQGIISSEGATVSFKDNQWFFKGNLTLEQPHLFLKNYSSEMRGNIHLSDAVVTITKNQVEGAFKISAPSAKVNLQNKIKLSGNINADISSLLLAEDKLNLKADYRTSKSYLNLANDLQLSGDISAKETELTYSPKEIVLNGQFLISNARMLFTSPEKCSGDIALVNLKLRLTPEGFSIESPLDIKNTTIQIDGKRHISGHFHSDILLFKQNQNAITLSGDLSAETFQAALDTKKDLKGNALLKHFDLQLKKNILSVNLNGTLTNTAVLFDNYQFKGSPYLYVSLLYDLTQKSLNQYSGLCKLTNGQIRGIPVLDALNNIQGSIKVEQNALKTQLLTFSANESHYTLSGQVKNFHNPIGDIKVKSDNIDIGKVAPRLISSFAPRYDLIFSGMASLDALYQGPLKDYKNADWLVTSIIKKGGMQSGKYPFLKDFHQIEGKISWTNQKMDWNNLQFSYKDKKYLLTGFLKNYTNPEIITSLETQGMRAHADFFVFLNSLTINSLEGSYLNSSLKAKGTINYSDPHNPQFTLSNTFVLSLEDLPALLPQYQKALNKISLSGTLSGQSQIKGIFKGFDNLQDYQIAADAQAQQIKVQGYTLYNNFFKYSQKKQKSKIDYNGHLYEGILSIHAATNLFEEGIPFKGSVSLKDLSLLSYRKDKNIKMSQLNGKLALKLFLEGEAQKITRASGNGNFSIKEGLLGEIAIVEGLVSAINNVPGLLSNILSNIASMPTKATESTKNYITGALGDFIIKDSMIQTNNTILYGSIYDLKIQGALHANQRIRAVVYPDYSRFITRNKTATEVLGSPVHLEISGTLKHPQYKPILDPIKPIKNAVGATIDILKGVKNLFEDNF